MDSKVTSIVPQNYPKTTPNYPKKLIMVQILVIGMGGIATVKVIEGIEEYMRTYQVEDIASLIGAVE